MTRYIPPLELEQLNKNYEKLIGKEASCAECQKNLRDDEMIFIPRWTDKYPLCWQCAWNVIIK